MKKSCSLNPSLDKKVRKILEALARLESESRYRAALVFGSVVRGEFKNGSDIDVKVIVNLPEHSEVNHIAMEGIKLDISFNLIETFTEDTFREIDERKRIPIIAESIILFDKDGELSKLEMEAKTRMKPGKYENSKYDWIRFLILNEDKKVQRNLRSDPTNANYIMQTGIAELIKIHYKLKGKWHVSNKRTLTDLGQWDSELKNIVVSFTNSNDVNERFKAWNKLIRYILKPLGGRSEISEISCSCEICKNDLSNLSDIIRVCSSS